MNTPNLKTLINASADGASDPAFIKGDSHIIIELAMTNFTGTLKFVGSVAELDEVPDFGASISADNPYENIAVKDYQNAETITGDTGISGTATTDVRILELNVNGLNWMGAKVSSHSGGSVRARIIGYSNK